MAVEALPFASGGTGAEAERGKPDRAQCRLTCEANTGGEIPLNSGSAGEVPDIVDYVSPRGKWVLLATVLGSSMASLDGIVVAIALPKIGREFHTSVAGLQWIVIAYTLALAGLLLLGGSLGDHFGRRRIFEIGVGGFAVSSALCAVAPDIAILVGARAVQGIAAALLTPGSLAILQASFRNEDRSRAIGAWTAFGGIAVAIGPFVGGWLISAASWRLIFLINLPIAAVVLVVSARHVPESRDSTVSSRLDLPGAFAITVGLAALTYGLIEAPAHGWTSARTITVLIVGAVALAGFTLIEWRSHSPMLPLAMFSSLQFVTANLVTFVVYAALSGAFFLLPIVLEQVAGYSPVWAGASLLPVTAIMFAFSTQSGALSARIGPRLQMSVGPVVIAAGLVLLTRINGPGAYLTEVLPAIVVFGVGLAINVAPLTATALASAPSEHAGMASAVNNDVARTGGLIAVALLPVVAGITGSAYLQPALLDRGFRSAITIAAIACACAGVIAALGIRNTVLSPPEAATNGP